MPNRPITNFKFNIGANGLSYGTAKGNCIINVEAKTKALLT
jgi:hypothetical protein